VIHYSFKDADIKNSHKGAKKEKITKAVKGGIAAGGIIMKRANQAKNQAVTPETENHYRRWGQIRSLWE
jgi:ribosomal protein L20